MLNYMSTSFDIVNHSQHNLTSKIVTSAMFEEVNIFILRKFHKSTKKVHSLLICMRVDSSPRILDRIMLNAKLDINFFVSAEAFANRFAKWRKLMVLLVISGE